MHDDNSTTALPTTLTIAQVADRMGLSPRDLQALRLRGLGPQIVQRGLSIHYDLAEVQEIERHEVMGLVEDLLACPQPLVRLRALLEAAGLPLSPLLQQAVRLSPQNNPRTAGAAPPPSSRGGESVVFDPAERRQSCGPRLPPPQRTAPTRLRPEPTTASTRSRGLIRRLFFRSDARLGLSRGDQWAAGW